MANDHGGFVWYELMTSDPEAARQFYRAVVGWRMSDSGLPDADYTIISAGEVPIGGLMALPEEACAAGARPCWLGYVGVPDVDRYAALVRDAGGAIRREPADIPGVGRFAVVADPHGATFMLFKGAGTMQPAIVPPGTPGHVGWHELMAGDLASDFSFYAESFGWTKADALDMGPMGTYQLFAVGGTTVGGMMTKPGEMPAPPHWRYYFIVEAVDAAVARVEKAGGRLLNGPMQVPGGSWIVHCLDPQGANFALVGPAR